MQVSNIAEFDKISEITNAIVEELQPEQIFLFGSFAKGTQNEDSDYDFYVLVDDSQSDGALLDLSAKGYQALHKHKIKRDRPVDILVNRVEKFNASKETASVARAVFRTGVCIYDKNN